MIYYVYTLPPCDWWAGFVPVDKYIETAPGHHVYDAKEWVDKMRAIIAQAEFWEGDPHTEAVSAIPSIDCEPILILSAKQSNNGTTFVASPVPLWHLHQQEYLGYQVNLKLVEWKDH